MILCNLGVIFYMIVLSIDRTIALVGLSCIRRNIAKSVLENVNIESSPIHLTPVVLIHQLYRIYTAIDFKLLFR